MRAADIIIYEEYEVKPPYSWRTSRARVESKHSPGRWNCRLDEDGRWGSLIEIESRGIIRLWGTAEAESKVADLKRQEWDKAEAAAEKEVAKIIKDLKSELSIESNWIDITEDKSGLPSHVQVDITLPLPKLRLLHKLLVDTELPDEPAPAQSALSDLLTF
jgi:hypothetical protein